MPHDTTTPEGIAAAQVETMAAHPAQVPQKFKNADGSVNQDALLKSYLELERQRTGVPAAAESTNATSGGVAADAAVTLTGTAPTTSDAESLAEALEDPKPPTSDSMWATVNKEFAATGTISDESAKLLIASGADPAILATFNAGRAAKQKADMDTAAQMVGGKENLDATLAWAKDNLSADEKASIIPQLRGTQAETILMGLHARRLAAAPPASGQVDTNQIAGVTIPGNNSPFTNLKPFSDWREQQAAMSDRRYQTDPEYRAVTEARLILGAGYEITR